MNVTSWLLRVKRARVDLVITLITSALMLLTLAIIDRNNRYDDSHRQQLAEGLAAGLARLAVEPLQQRDRIHLGVLANRLVDLPQVQGVTMYTVDDDMLALSGNVQRGVPTIAPVVQDDAVIGYVRLYLVNADTLDGGAAQRGMQWSILAALLIPLVVVGIRHVSWPARQSRSAAGNEHTLPPEDTTAPRCILAVNLFNQLSLPQSIREAELALAADLADAVAGLYYGRVTPLPGTGLVLDFDSTDDPDRSFQTICAAFLLARLLRDTQLRGQYRFGLHQLPLSAGEPLPLTADAVADAALLSALAREQTLAISDELFHCVANPERVNAQPLANPLLNQLESTPAAAWIATSLADAQQALIDQQAWELAYSVDATSTESTF